MNAQEIARLQEIQERLEKLQQRFQIFSDAVSEVLSCPQIGNEDGSFTLFVPREVRERFENQLKRVLEI